MVAKKKLSRIERMTLTLLNYEARALGSAAASVDALEAAVRRMDDVRKKLDQQTRRFAKKLRR